MSEELFDVVEVDLTTHKIKVMDTNKTIRNAEAVEKMAVIRRGVDDCFYTIVCAGQYKDGDTYQ